MSLDIHTFTVGPFYENTYLLVKEGRGLLIDPGFSADWELNNFRQKVKAQQITLEGIVLTHAHVDHVLGLQIALRHFEVPVYLSDEDRYLWQNFSRQASIFGLEAKTFDFDPQPLPEKPRWQVGSFTFDTLYTPGHSPDHIALYNGGNNFVLAGDALFKEGIGRTDLYKGDLKLLEQSIMHKLYTLPDGTIVYPGHGPATTIGHEKQFNPFVR